MPTCHLSQVYSQELKLPLLDSLNEASLQVDNGKTHHAFHVNNIVLPRGIISRTCHVPGGVPSPSSSYKLCYCAVSTKYSDDLFVSALPGVLESKTGWFLNRGFPPAYLLSPSNSAHQLSKICRRPPDLGKGKTPLDALQKLARDLIAHDVAFGSAMQLFASASLVNANHGYANGPCGFADAEAEVVVIGIDVAPLLESLDDLYDGFDERVIQVAGFKFSKELPYVRKLPPRL